jgi:hypothetical protein
MRKPAKRKGQIGGKTSAVFRQAAPIKGWISNENIVGMDPDSALQLDNWFPETNSIKLRPGYGIHNFIPGSLPVETVMVWQSGGAIQLFAAAGSSIYDVTAADTVTTQNPFGSAYSHFSMPHARILRRPSFPLGFTKKSLPLP